MTENVLKPPAEEENFVTSFCTAIETVEQSLDGLFIHISAYGPNKYKSTHHRDCYFNAKQALQKLKSLVEERDFFECTLPDGETLSFTDTCQSLVDTINENYELRKKLNLI